MVAQALYKATRGQVLLHALWADDESEDQHLVSVLPALDLAYSNMESAVQHILQQVLRLESPHFGCLQVRTVPERT